MSQKPTKGQLLAHYAERPVTRFQQYDGWKLDGWDDVIRPDEFGRGIMSTPTYELMRGSDVRVLVKPTCKREDVIALLNKIVQWIEVAPPDVATPMDVDDECSRCGAGSHATHAGWCEERDGRPVPPALALRRLANWVGENDCKDGTVAAALCSIAQEIATGSPELAFLPSSGSATDDEIPFD